MRVFVASWFFPPASTSEGNVTYKLLRNSRHDYVVWSSTCDLWTYKQSFEMDAKNIEAHSIHTDSFELWIEEGLRLFKEQHAKQPFDAFMTRVMPPESIEFGMRLKEIYPGVPWISSLADPVAKSPYDIKVYIDDSTELDEQEKALFRSSLVLGCQGWVKHSNDSIRAMVASKEIEDKAINNADLLVFPCETLRSYVLASRKSTKTTVVPHAYDKSLYPAVDYSSSENVVTLSFFGHSDAIRSLNPLIDAIKLIKDTNERVLEKLRFRFVGNVYEKSRIQIFNYYLYNEVSVEPGVDYLTSLEEMQKTDWLIHVDAKLNHLDDTGGSVYFAAKLADYMATDKPIFALTGNGSPADLIVRDAGGVSYDPDDVVGIAKVLTQIADGSCKPVINHKYRELYDAKTVAKNFDDEIEWRFMPSDVEREYDRGYWPDVTLQGDENAEKLITVCIPAYKVEAYLDRCLYSLISCKHADWLEILVVNDGSPDNARNIALAYQKRYPSIVRLIDKENGGHGSTINVGIEQAKGKYFRVVDGDDWVDSQNLEKLISKSLHVNLDADLVSSNYYQVYCLDGHTVSWHKVGEYTDYQIYDFANGDFSKEYFTLASSMIKTELLQRCDFKLQENTYYVDVEYILFPIPEISTVAFASEYVYRYAVGNAEQSINYDVFVSRYDHHDRVIRRMIDFFEKKRESLSPGQRIYMETLLVESLIKSHCEISLIMDVDEERGSERAKAFDKVFRETSPDLYKKFYRRHKTYRKAKRSNFRPRAIKYMQAWDNKRMRERVYGFYERLRWGRVGRYFAYKPYARAIFERLREFKNKRSGSK